MKDACDFSIDNSLGLKFAYHLFVSVEISETIWSLLQHGSCYMHILYNLKCFVKIPPPPWFLLCCTGTPLPSMFKFSGPFLKILYIL